MGAYTNWSHENAAGPPPKPTGTTSPGLVLLLIIATAAIGGLALL